MPDALERIDAADMFADPRNFALRVSGTTLHDKGINDGDYVIVRKADCAALAELYLAHEKESGEQSLRRWTLADADKGFEVRGVAVGLLRRY